MKQQLSTGVVPMSTHFTRGEDNGRRRSWMDRRQFTYAAHIPERRVFSDRRSKKERSSLGKPSKPRRHLNSWDSGRIILYSDLKARGEGGVVSGSKPDADTTLLFCGQVVMITAEKTIYSPFPVRSPARQ